MQSKQLQKLFSDLYIDYFVYCPSAMFELIFLLTNSSSKTKDIPTAIQTQERSHFLEHAQVGLT